MGNTVGGYIFLLLLLLHQSSGPLESKSLISPITDMPAQDDKFLVLFLALPNTKERILLCLDSL
jgi:hypothetical protein